MRGRRRTSEGVEVGVDVTAAGVVVAVPVAVAVAVAVDVAAAVAVVAPTAASAAVAVAVVVAVAAAVAVPCLRVSPLFALGVRESRAAFRADSGPSSRPIGASRMLHVEATFLPLLWLLVPLLLVLLLL